MRTPSVELVGVLLPAAEIVEEERLGLVEGEGLLEGEGRFVPGEVESPPVLVVVSASPQDYL
jgi:hypothetical protein